MMIEQPPGLGRLVCGMSETAEQAAHLQLIPPGATELFFPRRQSPPGSQPAGLAPVGGVSAPSIGPGRLRPGMSADAQYLSGESEPSRPSAFIGPQSWLPVALSIVA